MKNKKQKESEAAAAFFRTANSEDEFFLIEFDNRPKLAVPFTGDTDLLYHEITHTRPFGQTSLFDAIHMALDVMKGAHHDRKALVIISDGGDNRSRRTFTRDQGRCARSRRSALCDGNPGSGRRRAGFARRIQGPGASRRTRGIDRRPAFPGFQSGEPSGSERADRRTAARSVSARIQSHEPIAQTGAIGTSSSMWPGPRIPACTSGIARVITRLSSKAFTRTMPVA